MTETPTEDKRETYGLVGQAHLHETDPHDTATQEKIDALDDATPRADARTAVTSETTTSRQHGYQSDLTAQMAATQDAIRSRSALARDLRGGSYNGDRNVPETLGYVDNPTIDDYYRKYKNQDIATTIVDLPPNMCWRGEPEIIDEEGEEQTDFERDVETLFEQYRLLHYLERADTVAGIGRYGVLFLGFQDNADVDQPVDDGSMDSLDDLGFMTPYSERYIEDVETVTDPKNERHGLPEYYEIDFGGDGDDDEIEKVHWTRVIHVADNLLESEWIGRSRLAAVYNRLDDLQKVVGGASEMTWRGADRKFVINADKEMRNISNKEELREDIEAMIHDLQPAAYTRGMDVSVIDGEAVDPSGLVETLLKLIAGQTGIPQRILTGSERGELASTQDRATLCGRMAERLEQFCEPRMLRPTLDRFVKYGLIAPPVVGEDEEEDRHQYEVDWPDLFELSAAEEAEIRQRNARSLKDAAPGGDTGQLATVPEIRSEIMGWSEEKGSEAEIDELDRGVEPPEPEPGEPDPEIPDTPGRSELEQPDNLPEGGATMATFETIMDQRAATDGGRNPNAIPDED